MAMLVITRLGIFKMIIFQFTMSNDQKPGFYHVLVTCWKIMVNLVRQQLVKTGGTWSSAQCPVGFPDWVNTFWVTSCKRSRTGDLQGQSGIIRRMDDLEPCLNYAEEATSIKGVVVEVDRNDMKWQHIHCGNWTTTQSLQHTTSA